MNDKERKKAQDTWVNQKSKEKKETQKQNITYHEPDFKIFISSISMQVMIAMGKLENPLTGKIENNLNQARFLIDTLGVIKEKTTGNLNSNEKTLLEDALFNLRMLYINEKDKSR